VGDHPARGGQTAQRKVQIVDEEDDCAATNGRVVLRLARLCWLRFVALRELWLFGKLR